MSASSNMAAKYPEDTPAEELLNCLICTEPFHNPRVLPCHHTFCLQCLDKYFAAIQQEGAMEPGTFPCPVCRQVVNVPESGIEGLTCDHKTGQIQNLVEKISTGPKKRVSCDVCKYKKQEVMAKDHCASCGINYCEHCSKDHSKHCLFRNHSVVPVTQMDKSSLRCEFHDAEMVKYYCLSCYAPLCTVCAVTNHSSHQTLELHEALSGKKENVMDQIGGMSGKVQKLEEYLCHLEDVQSLKEASIKKTKMEIERHVTNMVAQIHMRKHAILEELELQHSASVKQINLEKEDAAFQLANMKSLWKFAAKLTEPSQSLQLLAMHGDLMQMIESTVTKPDPAVPNDCVLMNMFMPRQDLTVGGFQKHALSSDILQRIPTRMTNGVHNGMDTSSQSGIGTPLRPKTAPPQFFKDPFKVPIVKYAMSPKLAWKVDKVGNKIGEICETYDVTMLPDGSTVVAEWMNQRLQLFDEFGNSRSMISPGQIQPWGVTVNREGNLAVTDDKERTVKIVSPTGQIIVSWKKQSFGWPRGVCENSLGQYIVSDTEHGKHTVSIHLPDGRCVRKFGSQGSGNAQFHWPRYVTIDQEDRIIVSDGSNHCIKVLDASGQFMYKFGSMGSGDGQLKHPRGVCVDPQNNVIVADQDNNRVTLFSADGKFVRHLLAIKKPWGVSVSEAGFLAVTQKPSLSVFKVFDLQVS